ncbi:MAG: hypothetical protein MHMPM18_000662 [Marteilia pararefringens]
MAAAATNAISSSSSSNKSMQPHLVARSSNGDRMQQSAIDRTELQASRTLVNTLYSLCTHFGISDEIFHSATQSSSAPTNFNNVTKPSELFKTLHEDNFGDIRDLKCKIDACIHVISRSKIKKAKELAKQIRNHIDKIFNSSRLQTKTYKLPESDQRVIQSDCRAILEVLMESMSEEGVPLKQMFLRLPSKSKFAEYYEEIKRPITLSNISNKVNQLKYLNGFELLNDICLLVYNAQLYNLEESEIFQNSQTIFRLASEAFFDYLKRLPDTLDYIYCISSAQKYFYENMLVEEETSANTTIESNNTSLSAEFMPKQMNAIESNVAIMPETTQDEKMQSSSNNLSKIYQFFSSTKLKKFKNLSECLNEITKPNRFIKSITLKLNIQSKFDYQYIEDIVEDLYRIRQSISYSRTLQLNDFNNYLSSLHKFLSKLSGTKITFEEDFRIQFLNEISPLLSFMASRSQLLRKLSKDCNESSPSSIGKEKLSISKYLKFKVNNGSLETFLDICSVIGNNFASFSSYLQPDDSLYLELIETFSKVIQTASKFEDLQNQRIQEFSVGLDDCSLAYWGDIISIQVSICKKISPKKLLLIFTQHIQFFCQYDYICENLFLCKFETFNQYIQSLCNLISLTDKCLTDFTTDDIEMIENYITQIIDDFISSNRDKYHNIEVIELKNFVPIEIFANEFYYFENEGNVIAMPFKSHGNKVYCYTLLPYSEAELKKSFIYNTLPNEYYLTNQVMLFDRKSLKTPVNVLSRHIYRRLCPNNQLSTFICDFIVNYGLLSSSVICLPGNSDFKIVNRRCEIDDPSLSLAVEYQSLQALPQMLTRYSTSVKSLYYKPLDMLICVDEFYDLNISNRAISTICVNDIVISNTNSIFVNVYEKVNEDSCSHQILKFTSQMKIQLEDILPGTRRLLAVRNNSSDRVEISSTNVEKCYFYPDDNKSDEKIGDRWKEMICANNNIFENAKEDKKMDQLPKKHTLIQDLEEKRDHSAKNVKILPNINKLSSNPFHNLNKSNTIGQINSPKRINESTDTKPASNSPRKMPKIQAKYVDTSVQTDPIPQSEPQQIVTNFISFKLPKSTNNNLRHSKAYIEFMERMRAPIEM